MAEMKLTLRQIEAFRALMLTGSMTEAGRLLSVTQPAISKIISQLEAEVGFSLFVRRQGKLTPTEDAFILFSEVKQSYSGLDRIARAARRIQRGTGGSLRLVVFPSMASGFIVQVVSQLYKDNDNLQVSLQAYGSEEITDLVASGLYDVGFATTPIDGARIDIGPVLTVPSFCLLPPGHPLESKDVVSVVDLEGEDFIAIAGGVTSRLRVDALCTAMNVSRNIVVETRWSMTSAELVEAGVGCSIVDGFAAYASAKRGGIVRPLVENLDFTFVQVFRHSSTKTNVLEQFQRTFEECFAAFSADLQAGDFIRSKG